MNYNNIRNYVLEVLSKETELEKSEIDEEASFEELGIESVMMLSIIRKLEEYFGELPKTLFFEYDNLKQLIQYLCENNGIESNNDSIDTEDTAILLEDERILLPEHREVKNKEKSGVLDQYIKQISFEPEVTLEYNNPSKETIAIIGMSGRFADAKNIEEFYSNLKNGKDSVREIPKEVWDWSENFSTKDELQLGETYSKWGGYMDDIDKFDPLFFSISNKEAKGIDPQERIFLQTAVETLEDSGYTPESLVRETLGVFVGVMWGQYQLYGADDASTGSSYASIANRVSYFLNARGPSLAVDTMCSSSLTSLHLACKSILMGESSMALAGGVNITVHPNKYYYLSKTGFASTDGKCKSFGSGGDGYVPGDGSGAVLLKKLSQAQKDGDHIYGVILGSGLNHGGKTRGYTVPNVELQYELISSTLKEANVLPSDISYMEMHGTGTSLGDPIEIRSMGKNFSSNLDTKIPIGSVKSNIGHSEAAAGIAGLIKVLLQMRNKEIFPSLHSSILNPNINFETVPFYVNQKLSNWEVTEGKKRIASISAFGAGGSNAYVIIEEYNEPNRDNKLNQELYFPISASSINQVREITSNLSKYLLNYKKQVEEIYDTIYKQKINTFFSLCKYDKSIIDDETTLKDLELSPRVVSASIYFPRAYTLSLTTTVADIRQILQEDKNARIANRLVNKLIDTAYTLEYGRKNYDYRCLVEASTYGGLIKNLNKIDENMILKVNREQKIDTGYIKQLELNSNFKVLRKLWISGATVTLQNFSDYKVCKTSLPTYPFLKESCWFEKESSLRKKNSIPVEYRKELEKEEFLRIASKDYDNTISNAELKEKGIDLLKYRIDCCFIRFTYRMTPLDIISKMTYIIKQLDWNISSFNNIRINANLSQYLYLEYVENQLTTLLLFDNKGNTESDNILLTSSEEQVSKYNLRKRKVSGKELEGAYNLDFTWEETDSSIRVDESISFSISQKLHNICREQLIYDFTKLGREEFYNDIKKYNEEQVLLVALIQATIKENRDQDIFNILVIKIDKKHNSYFSFLQGIVRSLNKEMHYSQICVIKISDEDRVLIPETNIGGIFNIDNNGLLEEEVLKKNNSSLSIVNDGWIASGVYVLIGGSGTVGRLLTDLLKDKNEYSIIWFGRRSHDRVDIPNNVEYIQCDISNFEVLNAKLRYVADKFGFINSIWNLAMDFSIKRVLDLKQEDIKKALDIRVNGALNILRTTRNLNVQSLLFFSSAEAYIGNSGWGLYSASCLEMNKLIQDYVKVKSQVSDISIINWGFWKNKDETVNNSLEKRGIYPIDGMTGLSIINFVLENKIEELTVMRISQELSNRIDSGNNKLISKNKENILETKYTSVDDSNLLDKILHVFSEVLDIPSEKLDIDEDIANFGVDSIMLATLTKELKKVFSDFEDRILIENNTIKEISKKIPVFKKLNDELEIEILEEIDDVDKIHSYLSEYHSKFKVEEGNGRLISTMDDYIDNKLKRYRINRKDVFSIEVIERGEGKTLLLLPAIGLTAPIFINQFLQLSSEFRVICIHAPGYGISSSNKQPNNDELSEIYKEVLEKINAIDVKIIASCFGTILGTTLAYKYPSLIDKLVLVGGFYDGQNIQMIDSSSFNISATINDVSKSIGKDFDNLINKHLYKDIEKLSSDKKLLLNAICSNPLYVIRYLNELLELSTEQYLKNLIIDTLLVYGTDDIIIPNKCSQEMSAMIPNSTVYVMHNQGHYPYLTASDDFNRVVIDFLKEN